MHSIQCSANYFPGLRLFLIEKFGVLVLVFEGIAANAGLSDGETTATTLGGVEAEVQHLLLR